MAAVAIINRPTNVYPSDYYPDVDMIGGPRLTESTGYIPKEIQLQQLIDSGDALNYYYSQAYPDDAVGNDNEYDPTAQYGYDFFDWHYDVSVVQSKLAAAEDYARLDPKLTDADNAPPITPDPSQANPSPLNTSV